jgi:hypothetical protein
MNIIKNIRAVSLKNPLAITLVLFLLVAFKGEKDPLHKRKFNIMLDETRDGVPSKKGIADKFVFKDGRMFSDYLYEKYGYKWLRYRINKDSVFTDSTDTEVRQLDCEASATNEDNQTVTITFTSIEWDMDGVIKITKNDKLKKYFDFVGREKGGKPKKPKKKKENKVFELIQPGEETKPEEPKR